MIGSSGVVGSGGGMGDRCNNNNAVHRHSRVSPVPGRGSLVAYTPCPGNDPDACYGEIGGGSSIGFGNVLAIPMSAIQTGTSSSKTIGGSGSNSVSTPHPNAMSLSNASVHRGGSVSGGVPKPRGAAPGEWEQ